MADRKDERIPFSINSPEGHYRGEAVGRNLRDYSVFEVNLADGEKFEIEAVPDRNIPEYKWQAYTAKFNKLVPEVGRIIERYFKKKQTA
jgi:hypothetical protein